MNYWKNWGEFMRILVIGGSGILVAGIVKKFCVRTRYEGAELWTIIMN